MKHVSTASVSQNTDKTITGGRPLEELYNYPRRSYYALRRAGIRTLEAGRFPGDPRKCGCWIDGAQEYEKVRDEVLTLLRSLAKKDEKWRGVFYFGRCMRTQGQTQGNKQEGLSAAS